MKRRIDSIFLHQSPGTSSHSNRLEKFTSKASFIIERNHRKNVPWREGESFIILPPPLRGSDSPVSSPRRIIRLISG